MKVIHYFLGFPPYRSGGLTKYAYDLMSEQKKKGYCVIALWPGQMSLLRKKTRVCRRKQQNGIYNYELINPLPVPLDEGISAIDEFMKPCDKKVYSSFLEKIKPDAIHIHTLMGLHKEFVEAANDLGIRTIFTSHDYFGICPKVNLYRNGFACEDDHGCSDCMACNLTALSMKKIQIMQSPIYRLVKNSWFVRKMRAKHRSDFFEEEQQMTTAEYDGKESAQAYQKLRRYYCDILESVDCIHFNSTLTESIYRKHITPKESVVLNITHKDIKDCRDKVPYCPSDCLRITMLAPAKPYKGYNILRRVLDAQWEQGRCNFTLKMFCEVRDPAPYMMVEETGFRQDQLIDIFSETDVLIAPSVWFETFGFTVLEAISYGIPVIVSDHVGAKDIVGDGGIVVPANNAEALSETIRSLTPEILQNLHDNITSNTIISWNEFIKKNHSLYKYKRKLKDCRV